MLVYLFGVIVALVTMFYFNRYKNNDLHTPLFPALGLSLLSWFIPAIFLFMLLAYKHRSYFKGNRMNDFINNNSEGIIFGTIVAIILSTLLGFYTIGKHHTQAMADKGYVEQALSGTTNTIWVKPCE